MLKTYLDAPLDLSEDYMYEVVKVLENFNNVIGDYLLNYCTYYGFSKKGARIYFTKDRSFTNYFNNYVNKIIETNISSVTGNTEYEIGIFNVLSAALGLTTTIRRFIIEDNKFVGYETIYLVMLNTEDYLSKDQQEFIKYHELGHCMADHPYEIELDVINKLATSEEITQKDMLSNMMDDGIIREKIADEYAYKHTGFKLDKYQLLTAISKAMYDTLNDNEQFLNKVIIDYRESLDVYRDAAKSPEELYEYNIKNNDFTLKQFEGRLCYSDEELNKDNNIIKTIFNSIGKGFSKFGNLLNSF